MIDTEHSRRAQDWYARMEHALMAANQEAQATCHVGCSLTLEVPTAQQMLDGATWYRIKHTQKGVPANAREFDAMQQYDGRAVGAWLRGLHANG